MVTIPSTLIQTYKDTVDDFINNNFGVNCKFVFPPKLTPCSNCYTNTIGGISTNVYKSGGPAPFNFGHCPICGGNGLIETENTYSTKLRVYYRAKDWIKIPIPINIPDGSIQVFGFIYDLPKFEQTEYVIIDTDNSGYRNYRFERVGESYFHGLKDKRYFISFMKRSAG